jgi:hypothetical protein
MSERFDGSRPLSAARDDGLMAAGPTSEHAHRAPARARGGGIRPPVATSYWPITLAWRDRPWGTACRPRRAPSMMSPMAGCTERCSVDSR